MFELTLYVSHLFVLAGHHKIHVYLELALGLFSDIDLPVKQGAAPVRIDVNQLRCVELTSQLITVFHAYSFDLNRYDEISHLLEQRMDAYTMAYGEGNLK